MERIDTAQLKERTSIVDVISRHVNLVKRGAENVGICPFHDDHKGSLKVNESKGLFKCFACGASGDAIKFLVSKGYTFKEAVNEINGFNVNASGDIIQREAAPKKPAIIWKQIKPEESDIKQVPAEHPRHGIISQQWTYTDQFGQVLGYVCRFDLGEGEKEVIPLIFATDGKRKQWRWQGFDKPRPLYNLTEVVNSDKTILIVEGEKAAEAAKKLLPKFTVTTWQGGGEAVHHTDWTVSGRNWILWPDKDIPGYETMVHITSLIQSEAKSIRWVKNPIGKNYPTHWDIADSDWTADQAFEHIKKNIKTIKK